MIKIKYLTCMLINVCASSHNVHHQHRPTNSNTEARDAFCRTPGVAWRGTRAPPGCALPSVFCRSPLCDGKLWITKTCLRAAEAAAAGAAAVWAERWRQRAVTVCAASGIHADTRTRGRTQAADAAAATVAPLGGSWCQMAREWAHQQQRAAVPLVVMEASLDFCVTVRFGFMFT